MDPSHTYFMLWANHGSWIFQCPITLQSCICQVLWVRQFQVQTFWVSRCNFPLIFYVPGAPQFPVFFLIHTILCWALKAARTQVWQRSEVTGSYSFRSSPLLHSHFSRYFLTFPFTRSLPASICSPYLSSVFSISIPRYLFQSVPLYLLSSPFSSVLSLVLTPTESLMFPLFLHPSFPLGLSFTGNLPRVASIHLSALELSTPFLTQKPQRQKS